MKVIRHIAIALLVLCSAPAFARASGSVQPFSEMENDVAFLADSLREGRGFGTRGAQDAAFYIARRMKDNGLSPCVQCFPSTAAGHNIIAELKQNRNSDKATLICAYYDGLGSLDGRSFPCADSNASGVAAMLELCIRLRGCGRNFVFAALDGHSANLAGSVALAGFRTSSLKITRVVNLDTIGSALAPPDRFHKCYLIALGGAQYRASLEKANDFGRTSSLKEPEMRIYYDYYNSPGFTEIFYRKVSDQKPWLEKGIPCVMFTSGITMNTNKPTDTKAALDFNMMEKRVALIARWLRNLQ